MVDHNKVKLIVNYILIFTIVSVFSGLFYSIGQKKGIASAKRPVFIKYSNFTNKNIIESFEKAGIRATPEQIEIFTNVVKGTKHVRKN